MAENSTIRGSRFGIGWALAASLLMHTAMASPFVWYALAEPPEEPPTLVVELQGAVAENQAEEKIEQETKGNAEQDKMATANPAEAPPPETSDQHPVDDKDAALPPSTPAESQPTPQPAAEAESGGNSAENTPGAEERQTAQMMHSDPQTEREALRQYGRLLSKKVQANLVYPDEGRQAGLQGTATVSFAILRSGEIRPETLKIVVSSGQPKLDASALKTIRASTPFDPAPRDMTIAIAVAYGRKRAAQ
jgi:protein TonB